MTQDPCRRSNGQFQKGVSGNREGARRRKPAKLLTLEDLHRTVLKIAASEVVTPSAGAISVYEGCVRSLVSGGSRNRLGAKAFIELTKSAALFLGHKQRRDEEESRRQRARRDW